MKSTFGSEELRSTLTSLSVQSIQVQHSNANQIYCTIQREILGWAQSRDLFQPCLGRRRLKVLRITSDQIAMVLNVLHDRENVIHTLSRLSVRI
jgi:hypothetical protein